MLLPPCLSYVLDKDPQHTVDVAAARYYQQFRRWPERAYVHPGAAALIVTYPVEETTAVPAGYVYLPVPAVKQPSLGI